MSVFYENELFNKSKHSYLIEGNFITIKDDQGKSIIFKFDKQVSQTIIFSDRIYILVEKTLYWVVNDHTHVLLEDVISMDYYKESCMAVATSTGKLYGQGYGFPLYCSTIEGFLHEFKFDQKVVSVHCFYNKTLLVTDDGQVYGHNCYTLVQGADFCLIPQLYNKMFAFIGHSLVVAHGNTLTIEDRVYTLSEPIVAINKCMGKILCHTRTATYKLDRNFELIAQ